MADYASLGKKVQWHNGTQFNDVPGARNIDVDYGSRNLIEADDLAKSLATPQSHVTGLRGPATVTFTVKMDYDNAILSGMLTDFKAGTSRQLKYFRPDATPSNIAWATARITQFQEPNGDKESLSLAQITVVCEGAETEA